MQISSYLRTMYFLLRTDFIILFQTIHDKFIDLFIWVISMAAITIYLLPSFGLEHAYGSFMIVSMGASAGLFEQFSSVVKLVGDFDGDNITSFYLTLPIPSWMVFISYGLFFTINTAIISIFVLPIGKLCFWQHLDLSHINLTQYVIMLLLSSFFFAGFTLWMVSKVPNLDRIGNVWMRFIYPIWTFGAFQYSYEVLYKLNIYLAYASLLNPMTYIMEGTRAAVLGQQGSLNFWMCASMVAVFTVLCTAHGIKRIKKRLDYV